MELKEALEQVKILPSGDYAECGVYKGDSAVVIHEGMAPNTYLLLFDSFKGHPAPCKYDDIIAHPEGRYSDTSFEAVRARFPQLNVSTHRGFFPAAFWSAFLCRFRFVNVDCDLYHSVRHCIEFFRPRMVKGGIIRFDDYDVQDCPGATKACNEAGIHEAHWINDGNQELPIQ